MKYFIIAVFFLLSIHASSQVSDNAARQDNSRERVQMLNMGVSFVPPVGFEKARDSKAFVQKSTASSILLFEVPGISYKLYKDTLNADYFNSQNLNLFRQEKMEFSDHEGYIYECSFSVESHTFHRLFYITGNLQKTIIFIANYPENIKSHIIGLVNRSIKSIKIETSN